MKEFLLFLLLSSFMPLDISEYDRTALIEMTFLVCSMDGNPPLIDYEDINPFIEPNEQLEYDDIYDDE